MMDIRKIIKRKILRYAREDGLKAENVSILIGFSGGVDSLVLSQVLNGLRKSMGFHLALATVDYGIREDAQEALEFCRIRADEMGIDFFPLKPDTQFNDGSFESRAREIRYRYFRKLAHEKSFTWIFTAHHKDDQLETLFMKREQNADWISMQGIREKFGLIRRPMLDIHKKDIVQFGHSIGLEWLDDPTNLDMKYLRNRVRHEILPAAIKQNPRLPEELSEQCEKAVVRFEELRRNLNPDKLLIDKLTGKFIHLKRHDFLNLDDDERKISLKILITTWLKEDGMNMSAAHWRSFWHYLKKSSSGMVFDLKGVLHCLQDRDSFFISNIDNESLAKEKINNEGITQWGLGEFSAGELLVDKVPVSEDKKFMVVNKTAMKRGLFVRRWSEGDRILISDSGMNVKVSDLFINIKVPVFRKHVHPVVVDQGNNILWIPEIRHRTGMRPVKDNQSKKIIIEWRWN